MSNPFQHKYQQLVASDDFNVPTSLTETIEPKWQQFLENLSTCAEPVAAVEARLIEIHKIFACSDFIADSCIKNPKLLLELLR